MDKYAVISQEQLFFAVFCIEALSDDLGVSGEKIYRLLADDSDIMDDYIIPCYESLHTQGKGYIVEELKEIMRKRSLL